MNRLGVDDSSSRARSWSTSSGSGRRQSLIVPHKRYPIIIISIVVVNGVVLIRYQVDIGPSAWREFFDSLTRNMDKQAVMLLMNALILIAALLLVW